MDNIIDQINDKIQIFLRIPPYISLPELKKIYDILKSNTSIKELLIDYGSVNDKHAKYIAKVLKVNSSINTINLGTNHMNDNGIKYICEALKINTSVSHLTLGSNKMGSRSDKIEGAKCIAEMLKINHSLKCFFLGYNQISSKGLEYICEVLKTNTTLIEISFSSLIKNENDMKCFNDMLKENNTLERILLYGNELNLTWRTHLMNTLEKNPSVTNIFGLHDMGICNILSRNRNNGYQKSVTLQSLCAELVQPS